MYIVKELMTYMMYDEAAFISFLECQLPTSPNTVTKLFKYLPSYEAVSSMSCPIFFNINLYFKEDKRE